LSKKLRKLRVFGKDWRENRDTKEVSEGNEEVRKRGGRVFDEKRL